MKSAHIGKDRRACLHTEVFRNLGCETPCGDETEGEDAMDNDRIAMELVRIAKMLAASGTVEEDVDGTAYCLDDEMTKKVTATFEVEYDDDGEFVRVGDFLYAQDEDGNDVEIDEDSIDELSSKLKRICQGA